mmetsp:Transcript_33186/g.73372  ORF Transcript_33186/g.73372 Transcript_33186/m.73372 type:complete len:84 (+) Transcript_33186:2-253(+)
MAVGTPAVNNGTLNTLTTLTSLRRLKWHAGDLLDFALDPVSLKSFPKLFVLSITTSMFWRMSRWNALNVMELLPHCEVESVGL